VASVRCLALYETVLGLDAGLAPPKGRGVIVDGYVRVSQVGDRQGDSFISPSVQREQIESWAGRTGTLVAQVFEELDESGARPDRPLLEAAIKRVEAGETDGVVVAYLSRFGRSVVDGLQAIKRITDADGSFVSVQEDIDFSGDTGRLIVRMMLSIAEWELDRVRTMWRVADERAIKRGVYMGSPPFGYRRGEDGRLRVDPRTGPIATELFRRRAAGASDRELCRWLMDSGVRTSMGNTHWWSVIDLFSRRLYLGETRWGSTVNPAAHEPLVDPETWQLAQFRGQRRPQKRWQEPPLLWGIARCAGCQRPLVTSSWGYGTSAGIRHYLCGRRVGPAQCPTPAQITDRVIDPFVEAVFWQQLDKHRRPRSLARLAHVEQAAAQRGHELDAYRDNSRLPATLGQERFAAGLAVRVRRLDAARLAVIQARRGASPVPLLAAAELRESWPSLTATERREAMAEVIDGVFVSRGRRRPVEERVFVVLRGHVSVDLPNMSQQHRRLPVGPFETADFPPPPRLRPTRDWSKTKVDRELRAFLDGRDRWPNFAEFQAAGLVVLWEQVQRHGGSLRWAGRCGLPFVTPDRAGHVWTDERIRARLAQFLAGKNEWPSFQEFRAAGLGQLRRAVTTKGGPLRWAELMGVEVPPRRVSHMRWAYPRMLEEVEKLAAGDGQFPTCRRFREAGLGGLAVAIHKRGLSDQIVTDLRIRPRARRSPRPDWTDETIRAALDGFLQGRRTWPTTTEFRAAGLDSIYANLYRNGTRDQWAKEYGIAARPEPVRWTDTTIKDALDALLEGRDTWPNTEEFKEAGLGGLWSTLRRRQVTEHWRRRYGSLPPATRRWGRKPAKDPLAV
jgi:DNA invertase Pin-like site-specific DNA recombinase